MNEFVLRATAESPRSAVARGRRRPTFGPPSLETATARPGSVASVSRERNAAKFMAARIHQGMRICRKSFTHYGRRFEAGLSWWHVSAIPPSMRGYFAHTVEEIVAVSMRSQEPKQFYGVAARRRIAWRLCPAPKERQHAEEEGERGRSPTGSASTA